MAALVGYYWILSDIFAYFLNLSNFQVVKINGEQWVRYGNTSVYCYYIWIMIDHLINIYSHPITVIRAVTNLAKSIYYTAVAIQTPVVLPPGSTPA